MAKILTLLSLLIAFLLFPPATLALMSNNAVPGDMTYGIKRKLEDGILLLTSFNPSTKAWFAVERSGRRYKEAAILLSKGESASETLNELVLQTTAAANDISEINDITKKEELLSELSSSLAEYNQGLLAVEEQSKNIALNVIPEPMEPSPTPGLAISRAQASPTPLADQSDPSHILPTPNPKLSETNLSPTPEPVKEKPREVASPISSSQPVVVTPTEEITQTRKELEEVAKHIKEELEKIKQQKEDQQEKREQKIDKKDNQSDSEEDKDGEERRNNGDKGNGKSKNGQNSKITH